MGNLALAELADLLRGGLLAGFELDPGHDLLAILGVRHANHLHIADLRVRVEKLFDLAGIDVLAAANDHILDAPDDVDIALLVHGGQVSGMHPARTVDSLSGRFGIVPVAEHHAVPTRAEFTRLPHWHNFARRGINNLDLQVRPDLAYRAHALIERGIDP